MDMGTVLDGENAVDCGLIDHLGGLSEAIACLYSMIEEENPQEEKEAEDDASSQHRGT